MGDDAIQRMYKMKDRYSPGVTKGEDVYEKMEE